MIIDLHELNPVQRQHYLQASVAPRPICFASTIDTAGQVNLSPFSFFNLFSTTPPILIFSPSRRVRDNTTKHTWHNVLEIPEVVINIVDYAMVQQESRVGPAISSSVKRCGCISIPRYSTMQQSLSISAASGWWGGWEETGIAAPIPTGFSS
jgi:flavin reductase (DIM6/NTAB) family NADH-FMN oxidoreductase RutF